MLSPRTWWLQDVPLHSFVFCQFLIGIPFFAFNTYVIYQLQVVGYSIGNDGTGMPCTTFCIVSWAGTQLDLNSVLLYLNALAFGIGGALTLFLSAYSDFWSRKHILVSFFIVCYGAVSIPAYWLQDATVGKFQILTGLYIVFNIVTLILIAVLNIYIPHCMRVKPTEAITRQGEAGTKEVELPIEGMKRKYGFEMSIFGALANASGGIVMFIVVIILSQTLSGSASQSSGLIVTTIVGFVTVVGSLVGLFGLPAIPSKSTAELQGKWFRPIVEFLMPFKDLFVRKNAAVLLVSYTIYTDSSFAVSSALGQLFVSEIHPDALEYSLYALAQSIFLLVCTLAFALVRPRLNIRLESWLIIGYAVILLIPIWACIGLSRVDFGFKVCRIDSIGIIPGFCIELTRLKNRWEFYVQLLLFNVSQALANTSFKVLFSEMIPVGNEVRWFGMQLVLSCATVWVNYVASGPLQNATHQLRFPLVLSLIFLALALALEVCRAALPIFETDRQRWSEGGGLANIRNIKKLNSDSIAETYNITGLAKI